MVVSGVVVATFFWVVGGNVVDNAVLAPESAPCGVAVTAVVDSLIGVDVDVVVGIVVDVIGIVVVVVEISGFVDDAGSVAGLAFANGALR